jgi:hypothetical protein
MAYNLSRATIERMRPHLDAILVAAEKGNKLRFDVKNPHIFAYQIREALAAARHHAIEPYASLRVSISNKRDHVTAKTNPASFRGATPEARVTHITAPPIEHAGATSEFDVIAVLMKAPPGRHSFPSFRGDLTSVSAWAEARGAVLENENPLILTTS